MIIKKSPKTILFNAVLDNKSVTELKKIKLFLETNAYHVTIYNKVKKTNTLLIAKK